MELDLEIFVFSIQFILLIFETLNFVIFLEAKILQVLKFDFEGLIFFSLAFQIFLKRFYCVLSILKFPLKFDQSFLHFLIFVLELLVLVLNLILLLKLDFECCDFKFVFLGL